MVPLCVDCHQPHDVRKVFYSTSMANGDCMRCHGDEGHQARRTAVRSSSTARSTSARSTARKQVACAQCHSGVTPSLERSCETITGEGRLRGLPRRAGVAIRARPPRPARSRRATEGADVRRRATARTASSRARSPDATTELRHLIQARADTQPQRAGPVRASATGRRRATWAPRPASSSTTATAIHGKGLLEVRADRDRHLRRLPHGAHGAAACDPESTVAPENIVHTCGKCHDGIHEQLRKSVHSKARQSTRLRDARPAEAARLQRLPLVAHDDAHGRVGFQARHHGPVRQVPRRDHRDLLRDLPRQGLDARQRQGRASATTATVRTTSCRDGPVGSTCTRTTSSAPAPSATRTRTSASPASWPTPRTPTRRTTRSSIGPSWP